MWYQIFGTKMVFVNETNRVDSKTSVKRLVNPDAIHFTKYKVRARLTHIGESKNITIITSTQ